MNPARRRELGTEVCRRLAADVASIAPPGLGSWPNTWDMVAQADVEFLLALAAWEATPSEPARLELRNRYRALLDAWRQAARQYLTRGLTA